MTGLVIWLDELVPGYAAKLAEGGTEPGPVPSLEVNTGRQPLSQNASNGKNQRGVGANQHSLRLLRAIQVSDDVVDREMSAAQQVSRGLCPPALTGLLNYGVVVRINVLEEMLQDSDICRFLEGALSRAQRVEVVDVLMSTEIY